VTPAGPANANTAAHPPRSPADAGPMTATGARVIAVEVVTLAALWLLQYCFGQ
jgi:hypothetical protein